MYQQLSAVEKRLRRIQLDEQILSLSSRLSYWRRRHDERSCVEAVARLKLKAAHEEYDRTMREIAEAPSNVLKIEGAIACVQRHYFMLDHAPRLDKLAQMAREIREVEEIKASA